MATILIVDDARSTLRALEVILKREGYTVLTAASGTEGLTHIEQHEVDLLLCDVKMPKMDGLTVLRQVKAEDTGIAVVMMSGHGDISTAVSAMKEGAFDYLVKPFGEDEVLRAVQKALAMRALVVENLLLKRQVRDQFARAHVIGSSPTWNRVYQMVQQVAPSQATVLLTGESGTGKELIAGLLHRLSPRAERPFIVLNAAAMPATLLEAELFGHVRGSFTGAVSDRRGLWEEATGGTLFLDEIGDTSQAMQVKLLRALQEKEIRRVGASRTTQVDARVIAATNRDLEAEVPTGHFREDLYYRLSVVTLRVPALRERRSDIPLLAERFLRGAEENAARGSLKFIEETIRVLVAYDWPGNVRELQSAVEHAALHARGASIAPEDLPPRLQAAEVREAAARSPLAALFDDLPTLDELERRYLLHVLEVVGGRRTRAAGVLGIDRRTLYRMAERFGIQLTEE